jgi:integrase
MSPPLQDAARKHSRYGHRDATAILIAYRHGLRASELCELTWNMIELDSGRIHPHMLRHACGFKLANDGVDTRALQHFPRPSQHHAHGAIYRAALRLLRWVLEGLTYRGPRAPRRVQRIARPFAAA